MAALDLGLPPAQFEMRRYRPRFDAAGGDAEADFYPARGAGVDLADGEYGYVPSARGVRQPPRRSSSESSRDEADASAAARAEATAPSPRAAGAVDDHRVMIGACSLPSSGFAPPLAEGTGPAAPEDAGQGYLGFDDVGRLLGDPEAPPDYTHSTMIDACRLPRGDSTIFAAPLADEPAPFDLVCGDGEIDAAAPPPPVGDDVMIDACTMPAYAASATPDPYASWDPPLVIARPPPPSPPRSRSNSGRGESVSDGDLIAACTLPSYAKSSTPDPYA